MHRIYTSLALAAAVALAATMAAQAATSVAVADVNGDGRAFKGCAIGEHIKNQMTCGSGAKAAGLTKQGAGVLTLHGDAKSLTTGAQPGAGPHAIADQANAGTLTSYKASAKASTGGGGAGKVSMQDMHVTKIVNGAGTLANAAPTYTGATSVNQGVSKAGAGGTKAPATIRKAGDSQPQQF